MKSFVLMILSKGDVNEDTIRFSKLCRKKEHESLIFFIWVYRCIKDENW